MRRVAVTGIGIVSPLGNTRESFFMNLVEGRSGISRLSKNFSNQLAMSLAGQVDINVEGHPAIAGHVT